MRKLILLATMALAAAVLPSALASAAQAPAPAAAPATTAAAPTAAQLLAKTNSCKQISNGKYKTDEDVSAKTVAICDANGAVFWKADMDIDCDGQRTHAVQREHRLLLPGRHGVPPVRRQAARRREAALHRRAELQQHLEVQRRRS